MNREIKFRYYDSTIKQFIYSDEFSYPGICERLEMFFGKARNYSEDVIQQFTGLKDKNGKEIYEGDIIKSSSNLIGSVHFARGQFEIDFKKASLPVYNYSKEGVERLNEFVKQINELEISKKWESGEVIGNILENPELCESKVDKFPLNH